MIPGDKTFAFCARARETGLLMPEVGWEATRITTYDKTTSIIYCTTVLTEHMLSTWS